MKKILVVFLSAVLFFTAVSIPCGAEYAISEPVILISGFMSSPLFENIGSESEHKVWGPLKEDIESKICFKDIRLITAALIRGDRKEAGEIIADTVNDTLSPLRCNEYGEPVTSARQFANNPAKTNIASMLSGDDIRYLYEIPFCKYLNKSTDGGNIFCFEYDSRLDAVKNAEELRKYIHDILEYTGQKKVRIFTLSYGGLIAVTYLSLYGEEGLVSRLIMSVPALGGTDLPDRILRGKVDLNLREIVTFAETASGSDTLFSSWFDKSDETALSEIAGYACKNIDSTVKYWGSIWCLCSNDKYEKLKKDILGDGVKKEFIENIDYVHKTVIPNVGNILRHYQSRGVKTAILCGTGTALALGGRANGDLILPAAGVSGAVTADAGGSLGENYKCRGTVCSSPSHSHLSPDKSVDASTCYLPENTWFVSRHFHGQYNYENYTRNLVTELLLGDEINDIYSSPEFPQFHYTQNSYRSIEIDFDGSNQGFVGTRSDGSVSITNLTEHDRIKVYKITVNGEKIASPAFSSFIDPGETHGFEYDNPKLKEGEVLTVNIYYIRIFSLHPFRNNEFKVTVSHYG
ncbi:MAG: hypothetical protein K6B52_07630 [Clostridiales bacterium]|nr:hypothetical protein [Clostridiales bacterium]